MKRITVILIGILFSISVFALSDAKKDRIIKNNIKINQELVGVLAKIQKNPDVEKYSPKLNKVIDKLIVMREKIEKHIGELRKRIKKLGNNHPFVKQLQATGRKMTSHFQRIKNIKPDGMKVLKMMNRLSSRPRRPKKAR